MENPTSIRDALMNKVLEAAKACRKHRLLGRERVRAWTTGMIDSLSGEGGDKPTLNFMANISETNRLNDALDKAVLDLETYDRRVGGDNESP